MGQSISLAWDDRNRLDAERFRRHCTDMIIAGLGAITLFWLLHAMGLAGGSHTTSIVRGSWKSIHNNAGFVVDYILSSIGLSYSSSWWGAKNVIMNTLSLLVKITLSFIFHVLVAIGTILVFLGGIITPFLAMYLFRTKDLPNYHDNPTVMLVGVGGVLGGGLGYYCVMAMQGHPRIYLALWEIWILCHYILTTCAEQLAGDYYRLPIFIRTLSNLVLAIFLPYYLAVLSF